MIKAFAITVMAAWVAFGNAVHAETIRFAPLPMENRETVVKQFRPMTTFLEQRLNLIIDYVYSDNYADILAKFRQSTVDVAYLGPLPYVELRASYAQAQPMVHFKEKSGNTTYTCALITVPDADFHLQNANQRKIALTQPLSTCGYLSVSGLMRAHGSSLGNNYYRYVGKHDAVALSVIRGEFDAGGVKTAIARKYAHLGLQILVETPPLPSFALVANTRTLSPELISNICQALIALVPDGKDSALLASWGDNIRFGAVMASDDDYQVVRDLLADAVIPNKGNF
jgi:phosphonate transport system substrate-binding protein